MVTRSSLHRPLGSAPLRPVPSSLSERAISPRMIAVFFVLLALAFAPAALAQSARISLGASGGASVPLSATDRFVPRFEELAANTSTGPTYLVHQRPRTGMHLQVEALIRNMYIRYRFSRSSWAQDRVRCAPSSANTHQATLLPNGEYDDRTMRYDCGVERTRMDSDPDRRQRHTHHILAGLEFQALEPWRVVPYATAGGGIVLTQYHPAVQSSSVRVGLALQGGGGLFFPLDRNVALYIEAQYGLTLMARGGNYSLRAGRAVAANRTVLSAAIDPIHAFDATLGIRFRIR